MQMIIRNPVDNRLVTGQFVRRYPNGLTIDDNNSVRYYVDLKSVVSPKAKDIPPYVEDKKSKK